ncbi:hypothetical protein F2Q68_00021513 [Brassica cretica]|uniref:Uncharacterized protein n=1 Tax=Brassica cretica TaxID=69181 RepID=A0A8S9G591_BRACR|nr:hypothetical protein F2Q68_00021513 [Brassica cretica]
MTDQRREEKETASIALFNRVQSLCFDCSVQEEDRRSEKRLLSRKRRPFDRHVSQETCLKPPN